MGLHKNPYSPLWGWIGRCQTPPSPTQGEETWCGGVPQFLVGSRTGTEDRPLEPRAHSGGKAVGSLAYPSALPTWRDAQVRGRVAAAPPEGQTNTGTGAWRRESVCYGSAPPSAVGLGRLSCDPPEDCRSDGGSSSGGGSSSSGEPGGTESNSSPLAPEREILAPGDVGRSGHLAVKQRPVARSKIKVQCRLCPRRHLHHTLASGSRGPRPSLTRPRTRAQGHSAHPQRSSCTCPWAVATAPRLILPQIGSQRTAPLGPSGQLPERSQCAWWPLELSDRLGRNFLPFNVHGARNNQAIGVPVVGKEGPRHPELHPLRHSV